MNIFALKLPNGDNVRATDVKQEGDAIVEVVIGGEELVEITTPIGIIKAKNGTPVRFYKSGALKSFYPAQEIDYYGNLKYEIENTVVKTSIGTFVLYGHYLTPDTLSDPTNPDSGDIACEFYESGCPKKFYILQPAEVSLGEYKYNATKNITFYDSGSKDILLVESLYGKDYKYGEKDFISYQNKSGIFELSVSKENKITFWQNGSVKSADLYSSPKTPIYINDKEIFIRGGCCGNYDEYASISFFEDGSIASFTPDEVCMLNQAGLKLNIVVGKLVKLYKNGNIQECSISNPNTVKIKTKSYELLGTVNNALEHPMYDKYLFNEDGSLHAFIFYHNEYKYSYNQKIVLADTFYDNGNIKRIINYDNVQETSYVNAFYNSVGEEFKGVDTLYGSRYFNGIAHIKNDKIIKLFYLQPEDNEREVAMLYVGNDGYPTSYSLFKRNEEGEYILDDFGIQVTDSERKKIVNK